MPLLQQFHPTPNSTIGIWKITETVDELKRELPSTIWQVPAYQNIGHNRRRREWLIVRILLQQLLGQSVSLTYHAFGKPLLPKSLGHISISHSTTHIAVFLHPSQAIGIDIENVRPKVAKIAHKFLSPTELLPIAPDDYWIYTLYWSAKESLFKLYGKGNVDFKQHLHILQQPVSTPPTLKGQLLTQITLPNYQKKLTVFYQSIEEGILTYVIIPKYSVT